MRFVISHKMARYFLKLSTIASIVAMSSWSHLKAQVSITDASVHSLLQCLTDSSSKNVYRWNRADVADELVRRSPVDSLVAAYGFISSTQQRSFLLASVLYQIQDSRIDSLMLSILTNSITEDNYYSAMYLAKHGNSSALSILNAYFWNWPVSSWQMSSTAALFGYHKYYPATHTLIKALGAASLNLSTAALEALVRLYPQSPKFSSAPEAVKYYRQLIDDQQIK